MTYEEFDQKFRYHYRKDRLKLARFFGFSTISECTVALYEIHESSAKLGKLLDMTPTGVRHELRALERAGLFSGVRSRGGYNR